ncbi:MAG: histidine phosphatase family protein [Desulfobulbus sp.]|nr:histidine phosphatase family protein [Desulfobulbus sp.]
MKQLLICRHAKSSWKDLELSDFDRPLNKRGNNDALEMGRRLVVRGIRPDLICASPAVRAMETARCYAEQLGYSFDQIRFNLGQYAASVAWLVSLIQEVKSEVDTLLVVGHNPESTMLANFLSGLLIENIPTSGIVALECRAHTWREVGPGCGSLVFFDYPKKQV